jgi:molybdopterin molybdotransferase
VVKQGFETRTADWLGVDEALARVLEAAAPLAPERVPLSQALGAALAEDVVAEATLPPWDNSAMDGFAVRAADVRGAARKAPVRLAVVRRVRAGESAGASVGRGEAVRIMTGAPIPPGADSVVRVEDTDAEAEAGTVARNEAAWLRCATPVRRHTIAMTRPCGSSLWSRMLVQLSPTAPAVRVRAVRVVEPVSRSAGKSAR